MRPVSFRAALCAGTVLGLSVMGATAFAADATTNKAAANTELTEVVVTARKVAEPLQKAPIAVTALTQAQLTKAAVLQPTDLTYIAPSLSVTGEPGGGPGAGGGSGRNIAAYNVRGLTVGGAVYFAGAPAFGTNSGNGVIFDMSSVQIVAGPQGTLFGRTSVGGAVLFDPAKPTNVFDGYLQGSVGNLDYRKIEGMVNVPIINDMLNLRIAGYGVSREGYTTDLSTGQKLDSENRWSIRAGADFKPNKYFENTLVFQYNNVDEAGAGNVLQLYNPNYAPTAFGGQIPLYQFPSFLAGPFFGALCGYQALVSGAPAGSTAAFVQGCENQRVGILHSFGTDLASEAARIAAGGQGGVRATLGGGPLQTDRAKDYQIVNTSVFRAPDVGPVSEISIKNIFGYASTVPTLQDPRTLSPTTDPLLAVSAVPPAGLVQGTCSISGPNIGYCNYPVQTDPIEPSAIFQFSEEVNVSAKFFDRLSLLGGFFTLRQHAGENNPLGYAAYGNVFSLGLTPSTSADATAAQAYSTSKERGLFINATLDLGFLLRGLSVNGAYRHSDTSSVSAQTNTNLMEPAVPSTINATSESDNTHSFTVDWQALHNVLIYFRSGTGFIPGGVNETCVVYVAPNCPQHFAAETNTDYEIGAKADYHLGDIRMRSDAAFFMDDFTNIQVAAFIPVNNNGTIVTADPTLNSAAAKFSGIEFSQIVSYKRLNFNGNFSVNNGSYTKFFEANGAALPCVDPLTNALHDCQDLSGTPFQHSPKYKVNLQLAYDLPISEKYGTVTPLIQYSFTGQQHFGSGPINSPFDITKAYALVNLRIDWHNVLGHPFDADFFVRNLFDKAYQTELSPLYANSLFGYNTVQYGEPRFFGFELKYRFGAGGSGHGWW